MNGFKTIHAELAPGKSLESVRKAASGVFRQKRRAVASDRDARPDLITSLPFISLDEVKGEPMT